MRARATFAFGMKEGGRGKRPLFTSFLVPLSLSAILASAAAAQEPAPVAGPERAMPALTDGALRALYSGPSAAWPAPWLDPGITHHELAPLPLRPAPEPGSAEALQADLGARLFVDPLLSASGQFSCQSCHNRNLGWGDGLPRSFGHGRAEGRRNAPPLFTAGYRSSLFWDGRAASLEAQIRGPLLDPAEMANPDLTSIIARLKADPDYPGVFRAAYGAKGISTDTLAAALAIFQRGLERPSRFDRFLAGESRMLSDSQLRGLHLFRTKARCMNCHNGPLLSDEGFHNLGLGFPGGRYEDAGRWHVTGEAADAGRFRTPALRHVAQTGPWMHNGLFPSLEGLVNFYNGGGGKPGAASSLADPEADRMMREVSPHLRPLDLTPDEIRDIVAFLEAL